MMPLFNGTQIFQEEVVEPVNILAASAHFGIRDLLFGEPCHYYIKTLSFCFIYEIKYEQFAEVFEEDEDLMDAIETARARVKDEVELMYSRYAQLKKQVTAEDQPITIPSVIDYQPPKDPDEKPSLETEEYNELFKFRFHKIVKLVRKYFFNQIKQAILMFFCL